MPDGNTTVTFLSMQLVLIRPVAMGAASNLDAFIALAHATDSHELVGFVAGLFDLAVVPDRFVELIEMHQLEEHKRELDARIAALQAKSRGRG